MTDTEVNRAREDAIRAEQEFLSGTRTLRCLLIFNTNSNTLDDFLENSKLDLARLTKTILNADQKH